ncbi:MAG: hypothetical protein ACJ8OJ_19745 [Povalibacter sp.]
MAVSSQLSPITQRLRRIQQVLGVTADGVLGPETLTALETRLDITLPARAYSLEVSCRSLNAIIQFEVTSEATYEQRYCKPSWPGASSGVTVGIGYDLGMRSKIQIQADWQGWIADADLERLLTVQGVKGDAARPLTRSLTDVQISYDVAQTVFYQSTLPSFAALTRSTYPGVHKLPADAQGMLLSVIYNRGASLSGSRRAEMAAMKPLIAGRDKDLVAIANQVQQMARLWPGVAGLQQRRRKEADMIRNADREYEQSDLVRL